MEHYDREQSLPFSASLFRVTVEWCSYLVNLSPSLRGLALQPTTQVASYLFSERNIFISPITEMIKLQN